MSASAAALLLAAAQPGWTVDCARGGPCAARLFLGRGVVVLTSTPRDVEVAVTGGCRGPDWERRQATSWEAAAAGPAARRRDLAAEVTRVAADALDGCAAPADRAAFRRTLPAVVDRVLAAQGR